MNNQFPQLQFHSYFYYFMPLSFRPMYFLEAQPFNSLISLIDTSNNSIAQASFNNQSQNHLKPQITVLSTTNNSALEPNSKQMLDQSQSIFKLQDGSKSQGQRRQSKQASNDNRNVKSNILRTFFKRIKIVSCYGHLVQKIIDKFGLAITKQEFIKWAKSNLNVKTHKYVSLSRAKKIFKRNHRTQQTLILKMLFKHYQQNELVVQSLTSRKIKNKSIKNHLSGIRDIKRQLFSHQK